MALGFFIFMIYASYAYAFFLGGYFVDKEIYNQAMNRNYTGGDSISVFFGVLFGLFALGGASPQITAIIECRAAARLAFDLISRKPTINQDNQDAKKMIVEGQVEFRDVSFFYPSRVDQDILKKLKITFEIGKTTAIVGPSGSGKSTIV
jgi:ABC-type multidrug transport system fused ATPase/permease subunit